MTKISNTKQFAKIFGDAIVAQSQLTKKYVLNSKSLYSATLQKSENLLETVMESYKPDDTFIVFMIEHNESSDTMSEEDLSGLTHYDSFKCSILVYGEEFDIVAAKLYSRFLTEKSIVDFHEKGVHIQSIDDNGELTDFYNGHLLKRRDLIVHFSCQMDVNKIDDFEDMENMNDTLETYTL